MSQAHGQLTSAACRKLRSEVRLATSPLLTCVAHEATSGERTPGRCTATKWVIHSAHGLQACQLWACTMQLSATHEPGTLGLEDNIAIARSADFDPLSTAPYVRLGAQTLQSRMHMTWKRRCAVAMRTAAGSQSQDGCMCRWTTENVIKRAAAYLFQIASHTCSGRCAADWRGITYCCAVRPCAR